MWVSCNNCHKEFKTIPAKVKIGKGKYCTRSCYLEATANHVTKICLNCGKLSTVSRSQRKWDLCCSVKCLREYSLRSGRWKDKQKKKCPICSKGFISPGYRDEKYCSPTCFHISRRVTAEHKRERKREYTRKYRKEHADWDSSCRQRRRALEKKFGGAFTPEQWGWLKQHYNNTCVLCGKAEPTIKLTVDHIISAFMWEAWSEQNHPTYKWNDIQNIQPLCGKCNSGKGGKLL